MKGNGGRCDVIPDTCRTCGHNRYDPDEGSYGCRNGGGFSGGSLWDAACDGWKPRGCIFCRFCRRVCYSEIYEEYECGNRDSERFATLVCGVDGGSCDLWEPRGAAGR